MHGLRHRGRWASSRLAAGTWSAARAPSPLPVAILTPLTTQPHAARAGKGTAVAIRPTLCVADCLHSTWEGRSRALGRKEEAYHTLRCEPASAHAKDGVTTRLPLTRTYEPCSHPQEGCGEVLNVEEFATHLSN